MDSTIGTIIETFSSLCDRCLDLLDIFIKDGPPVSLAVVSANYFRIKERLEVGGIPDRIGLDYPSGVCSH